MVSLEGTPSGSALQSSNTNAALVPATALVAEGQTAATFPIETKVVTATTSVTIGATYGVTSRNATLTVQAPAGNYPSQLTITPTTLDGGTAASGTVTMKMAAASNLTVALSSSDPTVASVPASVTVAKKKTQAPFTVTTFSVATQTPVTITASYGGVIQRVRLTVNPQQGADLALPDAPTRGAERVARCASLALTPCLMSLASPATRQIQPTVAIEQSRYNLYTPELTLMAETETSGATAKAIAWEYVFFGGEPMAQIETATGEVHWYFTDHLGTPVLTTDGSGSVDWSVEREPYGLGVTTTGDRRQPFAFPGQENTDAEPSYNVFRWYSGARSRYNQTDPIALAGGPNLYSYVYNPIRDVDPFGLIRIKFRIFFEKFVIKDSGKTDAHIKVTHTCQKPTDNSCGVKLEFTLNGWWTVFIGWGDNGDIRAHELGHVDLHQNRILDAANDLVPLEKKLYRDVPSCEAAAAQGEQRMAEYLRETDWRHFWWDVKDRISRWQR